MVDGRTLSWEELGHALSSYEGWRFPLVIEDRSLDVRPDAHVLAFPIPQPDFTGTATGESRPSIDDVLSRFLGTQEQRLAERTFAIAAMSGGLRRLWGWLWVRG